MALLMALSVVMLLTVFMTEYFFATGLELRGMTTYKESEQARALARAVLKVVVIGLQMDEVEFFKGFRQVEALLEGGASLPWKSGGLLLALKIAPQDHLYNLNELRIQPGGGQEMGRRFIFYGVMEGLEIPPENPEGEFEEITPLTIEELYTGLYDWIDADSEVFIDIPSTSGAEAGTYFSHEPEVEIKNGMLDRLSEIRMVRGVLESRVPWMEWEQRFTTLPREGQGKDHLTEKINVNTASYDEIVEFLNTRRIDPNEVKGFEAQQTGVNKYIDQAEELAGIFAPAEGDREIYDQASLKFALEGLDFKDNYGIDKLFSTVNRYYRISLVTEMSDVQARLEAMVKVSRDKKTRISLDSPEVLWWTLR